MTPADPGMPSLPDRSERLVLATEPRKGTARQIWSALTFFVAVVVGMAMNELTEGPWWVGALASMAVLAVFWVIEWAVDKRRRPAKDPE